MALVALPGCTSATSPPSSSAPSPTGAEQVSGGPSGSYIVPAGIHKIKHVVIVMQENRSFAGIAGVAIWPLA